MHQPRTVRANVPLGRRRRPPSRPHMSVRRVAATAVVVTAMLVSGAPAAFAGGDLDGDGNDDLVVGSPDEGVGRRAAAGAINILMGSETGISARDRLFTQSDIGGTAETGDRFGNAIAYGDFDKDGFDDIAVGSPTENFKGKNRAGVVHVIYGSAKGANRRDVQLISQAGPMAGAHEAGDFFGAVLVSGDFDNDGFDDLAIGVPGENIRGQIAAGGVVVAYGSRSGITTSGSQMLSQKGRVPGKAEHFDAFGAALAVGDFNNDKFDDLVIGVPGEDLGSAEDSGLIIVLYGRKSGLNRRGAAFSQSGSVPGDNASGDAMGKALTVGDFNGDGRDDVAVGVPGKASAGMDGAGVVLVFSGGSGGLSEGATRLIDQDSDIPGDSEVDDAFGSVLAAGNFNGDKLNGNDLDDLVVGIPLKTVGGQVKAGQVVVIPGSASGPDEATSIAFSQSGTGGFTEADDRFGASLRVGNFNGDKLNKGDLDDLAVASPTEDLGSRVDAGIVHVVYGSAGGLDLGSAVGFHQAKRGIKGKAEPGDRFGTGL